MIYVNRMITSTDARHNFRTYRLVRLLHALKAIDDIELIAHEELIWRTSAAGISIDWERYRIYVGAGEYEQF